MGHKGKKGSKVRAVCRKCGITMVSWSNIDHVCINCDIWGSPRGKGNLSPP